MDFLAALTKDIQGGEDHRILFDISGINGTGTGVGVNADFFE